MAIRRLDGWRCGARAVEALGAALRVSQRRSNDEEENAGKDTSFGGRRSSVTDL